MQHKLSRGYLLLKNILKIAGKGNYPCATFWARFTSPKSDLRSCLPLPPLPPTPPLFPPTPSSFRQRREKEKKKETLLPASWSKKKKKSWLFFVFGPLPVSRRSLCWAGDSNLCWYPGPEPRFSSSLNIPMGGRTERTVDWCYCQDNIPPTPPSPWPRALSLIFSWLAEPRGEECLILH